MAGGFTAVACMPNTSPVNDNAGVTEYILKKAAEANLARVYPIGAVSRGQKGEQLADIAELKQAGCVALTDDGRPVATAMLMRRALEYAGMFDLPIIEHCEEQTLKGDGVAHEGFQPLRHDDAVHAESRPAERTTAPRLRGSVTESSITISGGSAGCSSRGRAGRAGRRTRTAAPSAPVPGARRRSVILSSSCAGHLEHREPLLGRELERLAQPVVALGVLGDVQRRHRDAGLQRLDHGVAAGDPLGGAALADRLLRRPDERPRPPQRPSSAFARL